METLFADSIRNLIATNPALAFVAVFVAGIFVGLTPCVYPLIPITLGYIGAKSAGSRWKGFVTSSIYVSGMALTYACLGAFASLTGKVFGQIGSHPLIYFIVANVFLFLGLSMLGLFNFPQIPLNASGRTGKRSGYLGVFIVGLFSGLIVGPCTAPVLGAILVYVGTKQNVLYGFALLFVYGYGVGLLLVVLGTFTGFLTSLPKSGVWLERIKKGFGWVLVLAAEVLLIKTGGLL
jgi:cytochrome c-type biogenesis protein